MKGSRSKALKRALISAGSLIAYALTGGLAMLPLMLPALMRRGREEDVAVGYNMIASCLIAGIIMAVAKPLATYITGIDFSKPPVGLEDLAGMVDKLFTLITYLGVVILVIGLIMAGINLVRRPKIRKG